jgi:drug/metabolite transporter (DMT)-like permease
MAAVLLALAASLCWGCGDFIGGWRARRLPVLTVLFAAAPVGLVAISLVVAIRAEPAPGGLFWLWTSLSGLGGAIGIAGLYKALAVGRMGVVAPITATAPLIPVVAGLVRGERPSTLQYTGMAVAFLGIAIAAREVEKGVVQRRIAAGVGYALIAFAGFGSTQLTLDEASNDDPYWATFVLRLVFTALIAIACAVLRPGRAPRAMLPSLVLLGLLDIAGTLFFAVATSRGLLSVVAVLGSLYPVVVIALARIVLRERLARIQLVGAGVALAGAALISAG